MINNRIIEVCIGNAEDVAELNDIAIDRIELNSALELGGLTVSVGELIEAKKLTSKPICCMVRPRGAGFCYSDTEYNTMIIDAKMLLENGADGIVFGFLNKDDTIDLIRTKAMADLIHSYGKEAIFHKAFDETHDMEKATLELIDCGINRILTSGGKNYPHIENGFPILKDLISKYNDKITFLVGGGVRDYNVASIIENTNCSQIHMSSRYQAIDNGEYDKLSKEKLIKILENI
ncbi:MAG: copper homeostasis protein CutC [Firmicutes bacterium]|nr:copper homeostasis protein CutC [Bacillota bacterium]